MSSSLVPTLLFFAATWCNVIASVATSTPAYQEEGRESNTATGKNSRGLFSPRMDYDEWTPLGRGDPLKNDPTYVYVPPVLERVHYWVDPSSRTPAPEVPILRSTHEPTAESRLASFVDPFLKFTSTPHQQHYYVMQSPYYKHMYQPKQRPTYHQREPYTMLVPPPIQAVATFSALQTDGTTTTAPTISDWAEGKTQLATIAAASNQVTWKMAATTTTTTTTTSTTTSTSTTKPKKLPMASSTEALTTLKQVYIPNKLEPVKMKPPPMKDMRPLLASLLKSEWTTTMTKTTPANIITMTTVPSLTTDPLFSHYKQPAEPMRGPMYLIIQGHSKVKTYGASNAQSYHGIPLQETNEIHQEGDGDIARSGRGVEEEQVTEESCQEESGDCKTKKRKKRQLEIVDFIPIEEASLLLEEYLEGSGIAGETRTT